MRIDDDVGVVCSCKTNNFTIVPVCTIFLHSVEMSFEICVDLCSRWHSRNWSRSNVLSLWVSAISSTVVDWNEVDVLFRVVSHFLDDPRPDLLVMGFVAVNLVGKSIEETIT